MGQNATSLALVRSSDNLVETFLRLDIPEGWEPPEGYYIIPDDELPSDFKKVPEKLPEIPKSISARQIRLWLIKNNISLLLVESAIDSIGDQLTRESVRIEWEYAPYVERNHPWIEQLGQILGLDSRQIDQAFIEASNI